jgi:hypothetical protein
MSEVKDLKDKQQYQFSFPTVWPDGSEFSVYSSPDAEKMIIQHSSGSHIEFKRDGSVFLKAVGDLHLNSSVGGKDTTTSDKTTLVFDGDMNINVEGALGISCKKFDMEVKNSANMVASQDFKIKSNNAVVSATESVSLEPEKSLYIDTKEMRERVVSHRAESGSMEEDAKGGLEVRRVYGNAVIENLDPKGGITIKSAGYLNFVCAAERVDITGDPSATSANYLPSSQAKATYTHIVRENTGPQGKGAPGSAYFECGPGGVTNKIVGPVKTDIKGTKDVKIVGNYTQSVDGSRFRDVTGIETIDIEGIYRRKAKLIYLN